MPIRDGGKWIVANCVGLLSRFKLSFESLRVRSVVRLRRLTSIRSIRFYFWAFSIFAAPWAMSHDHDTKPATFDGWWDGFLFLSCCFFRFSFSAVLSMKFKFSTHALAFFFFVRSAIQRRRVSMDSDLRSKLFISLLFLSRLAATVRVHDYAKMVRM